MECVINPHPHPNKLNEEIGKNKSVGIVDNDEIVSYGDDKSMCCVV